MADVAPSAFGAWLRRQRKLAGLTQEELANRAGLSARGVAAIERGRRRQPLPHTVRSLATALGVPASEQATVVALLAEEDTEDRETAPLPAPLPIEPAVALVGRDAVLDEVLEKIEEDGERLVTLTGPGGVGKTTLALEVAYRAGATMPDGAVVVTLESLTDASALPAWIATRLGLSGLARGAEWQALNRYFGTRRTLLVLDNFEHVLGAAPDVARLMAANPGLQVLVTSRAPLRLRGEREVPVDPLAVPDLSHIPTPEEIASSDAVQLFVERAQASVPSFAVTQANATAIAAICRRLDGLPLALELAAARLRILSPTELLARLDQVLPVLVGGARDLPERQRTIRQAIDWSYRLLGAGEQALFRRLATFTGGWDLEAAEAIASGLALDGADPLDVLTGLVEHSLVVVETSDVAGTRYRMLETIRAFGRDELDAHGETAEAMRVHAGWCLTLAERAAVHNYGPEEADWLDRLERDQPNLRAAVVHAVDTGDEALLTRLVAALGRFWLRREYIGEGVAWREMVLRSVRQHPPTPVGATVLFHVGRLAWEREERAAGIAFLRESVAHWSATGDVRGACGAVVILANMLRLSGETAEADTLLDEARSRLAQLDDARFWYSLALRLLGIRAIERGDLPGAEQLLSKALETARESGDPWSVGSALHNLADLMHRRGEGERALALFGESLDISFSQRDRWSIAVTMPPVAEVVASLGEAEAATRLLGAAERLGEAMAARLVLRLPVDERQEQTVARLRRTLGEAAFDEAWCEGRLLTAGEAIEAARRAVAERRQLPAPLVPNGTLPAGLSQREVEVIRLVATGMSNAEAADALFLSRRTVDAHLRRIYDKLDLASRTELARFAREHALLEVPQEDAPAGSTRHGAAGT